MSLPQFSPRDFASSTNCQKSHHGHNSKLDTFPCSMSHVCVSTTKFNLRNTARISPEGLPSVFFEMSTSKPMRSSPCSIDSPSTVSYQGYLDCSVGIIPIIRITQDWIRLSDFAPH